MHVPLQSFAFDRIDRTPKKEAHQCAFQLKYSRDSTYQSQRYMVDQAKLQASGRTDFECKSTFGY
jgi:hypothetical protein